MKDALGHGSAAHQAGVQAVGTLRSFMHDESGTGVSAAKFMPNYGDQMDPVTLAEMPATHAVGYLAHTIGL